MLETDLHQLIELFPGESDDDLYELTCAAFEEEPLEGPDRLPPDLDLVPPGTFLGAILSSIDLSRLSGHDVVTVMKAHQRQIAHHQAGIYAAMSETAHCADPDTTSRTEVVNEFAPEEIGAALTLTRRMANRELAVALDTVRTLPAVHRALASGHIDARKATILTDHTAHLEDDARRRVIDQILKEASHLTTGQLTARLRRLATEADPEQAKSRFELSLSERKVVAEPNLEGTAALVISQCSPEDILGARDHIDVLARRLKTEDEPRTIDQLRADVAIGLLNGSFEGGAVRRGSVTINVDLTTLAGLSDGPAELGGYGPVLAEIARKVAKEQTSGIWSAAVTDPETGEPLHVVSLRRRPTAAQTRKIRAFHPTCVHPGCRMPAVNCDLDHRIDHARGGPTTVANHAPLCRRHHMTKHKGGWRYRKIGRTGIEWLTPLGHRYRTSKPP
ncbi:MAG: DUF222 domain-containing protein [Acidimicrobiia bacterium]